MRSHVKSLKALLREGKKLKAQKKHLEALEVYEQAAQLDTISFEAWSNVGYLLNHLERYAEALPAHERATQLHPTSVPAWSNKGLNFIKLNRPSDALQHTR